MNKLERFMYVTGITVMCAGLLAAVAKLFGASTGDSASYSILGLLICNTATVWSIKRRVDATDDEDERSQPEAIQR